MYESEADRYIIRCFTMTLSLLSYKKYDTVRYNGISYARTYTPCPRKNCTPVYVAITLAKNVGF